MTEKDKQPQQEKPKDTEKRPNTIEYVKKSRDKNTIEKR